MVEERNDQFYRLQESRNRLFTQRLSKSEKSNLLTDIRRLEQEVGVPSYGYNSKEFKEQF